MGKIDRQTIWILVATESESGILRRPGARLIPIQGYAIGDWGYNVLGDGSCRVTHLPSGRQLALPPGHQRDSLTLYPGDAERVILVLNDAFPMGAFRGGSRPVAGQQWVFEALIAAAVTGDYVFTKRSR